MIFAFKSGPCPSGWADALNLNKETVASCYNLNRNSANYSLIEAGLPLGVFSLCNTLTHQDVAFILFTFSLLALGNCGQAFPLEGWLPKQSNLHLDQLKGPAMTGSIEA